MGRVALLLIDEIHLLVDPTRGPTLEAVVSRMLTISKGADVRAERRQRERQPLAPPNAGHHAAPPLPRAAMPRRTTAAPPSRAPQVRSMPVASLRIFGASATIENVEDVAAWLGPQTAVKRFGDEYRPV